MRFVEIINYNKFTLISISLCLYVMLNLFDGERGLISYFEKKKNKRTTFTRTKITSASYRYDWKKE